MPTGGIWLMYDSRLLGLENKAIIERSLFMTSYSHTGRRASDYAKNMPKNRSQRLFRAVTDRRFLPATVIDANAVNAI